MQLTPEIAEKYCQEDFPRKPLESGTQPKLGSGLTSLTDKGKLPPIHGFEKDCKNSGDFGAEKQLGSHYPG